MSKERGLLTKAVKYFENKSERAKAFSSTLREDLTFLRDEYGLKIRMGRFNDSDTDLESIKKLRLFSAERGVRLLREEIEKYPPELIRGSGLKIIRLVKEFERKEETTDGGTCIAFVNYEKSTMTLSAYWTQSFHHELMHFLDKKQISKLLFLSDESPTLYSILRPHYLANMDKWKKRYSDESYLNGDFNIEHAALLDQSGFFYCYGMKSQCEDRAVTAQAVMLAESDQLKRIDSDPILFDKAGIIKDFLEERSNGLMDEQYFEDLKEGKVKKGYWQERIGKCE